MPVHVKARLLGYCGAVRVLISGATGFIGRALVPRLQRNGHSVVAWARSDTRAMALLGADIDVVSIAAGHDALGPALHRPAILPTPALALRAIFGEAAVVLLASQRVKPDVARRLGFAWEFPSVDAALRDIVDGVPVEIVRLGSVRGSPGSVRL